MFFVFQVCLLACLRGGGGLMARRDIGRVVWMRGVRENCLRDDDGVCF